MRGQRRTAGVIVVATLLVCLSLSLFTWEANRRDEVGTTSRAPLAQLEEGGLSALLEPIQAMASASETDNSSSCDTFSIPGIPNAPNFWRMKFQEGPDSARDTTPKENKTTDAVDKIPEVKRVVLESEISTLAVLGQLTSCGVPIPDSIFFLYVGLAHPSCGNTASVTEIPFLDAKGRGIRADGAQITYIIPGNGIVSFAISRDQFIKEKKYWLQHLPNDPPGAAALAFF